MVILQRGMAVKSGSFTVRSVSNHLMCVLMCLAGSTVKLARFVKHSKNVFKVTRDKCVEDHKYRWKLTEKKTRERNR